MPKPRSNVRLTLIAIGKLKAGPERELCSRYGARVEQLSRLSAFGPVKVIELKESRANTVLARTTEEAQQILSRMRTGSKLICLDERGENLTSQALATALGELRDNGLEELMLAIGGPDGHGPAIRNAAARLLSLGKQTLPHGLARVVLMEQLYRTATLLAGHPYHRG